jgi:hypothetical protein
MMGKTIFADFNNFDPDGYIRLNCVGTTRKQQGNHQC